ncbi:Plasmodium exported protein, unknown function [Plasmodium vinckei lentum]|uniref:Uncharacterized protein n=1 Tax=Plasmodium vinckei lentum TaxID=138297 RepID=A0A6V7RTV5_PLAVN|nr:Plasmodium exported protein, unknown function [Plasmodium vinckei lentum]
MANIQYPTPKHTMNYSYGKNESNKNFTKKYVYIPLSVAYLIKLCKTTTIKILPIINMLHLCIFLIWTTNSFNYKENYYDKQKNSYSTVYRRLLSDANLIVLGNNPVTNSIIDNRNSDNENLLLVPFLKRPRNIPRRSHLKAHPNESIKVTPREHHNESPNGLIKVPSNRNLTKSPNGFIKVPPNVTQGSPQNRDLTKSPNGFIKVPPKATPENPPNRDLTKSPNGFIKVPPNVTQGSPQNRDLTKSPNGFIKVPPNVTQGSPQNRDLTKSPNGFIKVPPKATPENPPNRDLTKSPNGFIKVPPNSTQGNPPNRDLTKSPNGFIKVPPKATQGNPPNRDLTKSPNGFIKVPQRRDLNGYTKLNKNENTELISNIPKEILQKAPPNTRIYIRKLPPSQLKPHLSGNVPGNLKSTEYSKTGLDDSMKRQIPPTGPTNFSRIKGEANMPKNMRHGNRNDKGNNSMPNNNSGDGSLLKVVKGVEHYTKSFTDSIRNNLNGVEFKENHALDIIEKNVSSGVKIANTSMKKGMNALKENTAETLKAIDTDIKPCINNLKDSIIYNVEAVKSGEITISDIKDSVIDTINNNIENTVKPKTEQIKSDVSNKIGHISTQLKTQAYDIKDNIKEGVQTIGTEIIPQIGHTIKDTVGDTIGDIATGIEKSSDVVKEKVIKTICKTDIVPTPIKEIVKIAADENITSIVVENVKNGKPAKGIKAFFKRNVRRIKLAVSLGISILTSLGALINLIIAAHGIAIGCLVVALLSLYYFIYIIYLKDTKLFKWIRSLRKKK